MCYASFARSVRVKSGEGVCALIRCVPRQTLIIALPADVALVYLFFPFCTPPAYDIEPVSQTGFINYFDSKRRGFVLLSSHLHLLTLRLQTSRAAAHDSPVRCVSLRLQLPTRYEARSGRQTAYSPCQG